MAIRPFDEVALRFIEPQFPHPGNRCHTWGKTYEAAVRNAEEGLELYLETLAAHGDPIPDDQAINEPVSLGITVRMPVIS